VAGFRTQFSRFEGSDIGVIVLANSNTTNPVIIANRIAAVADPALTPPPTPSTPIADDPAVTSYVRDVLALTARGELKVSDFEFVRTTVVPRMGASYARLLGSKGALQQIALVARGEEGDDKTFVYRLTYANGIVRAGVKIGPKGRLTGLQLSEMSP